RFCAFPILRLYFFTSPLRCKSVFGLMALDVTVMTLCCFPIWPSLLNTTFTLPTSPGAIGFLEYSGVVQPQEACTLETISGSLPVLVNVNSCSTFSPSSTWPKSYESFSTSNTAPVESAPGIIVCPTGCLPCCSKGISAAFCSWLAPLLQDTMTISPAKIKNIHFITFLINVKNYMFIVQVLSRVSVSGLLPEAPPEFYP